MGKKKKLKQIRIKKTFKDRLTEKLISFKSNNNDIIIQSDCFSDNSGCWVSIKQKGVILSIGLSSNGEDITDIGLYQEVVEVTSEKKVWEINN